MGESFLHYLWATSSFRHHAFTTSKAQKVKILDPGKHNLAAGPDFYDGRFQINGMQWCGQVEMHIDSRDWYRHHHHLDPVYNSVVLHVVFQSSGKPIIRQDGSEIPEISLKGSIDPALEQKYYHLELSQGQLPCEGMSQQIPAFIQRNWMTRMGAERLESRIHDLVTRFEHGLPDWEQIIWEELCAFMGGKINRDAFRTLGRVLPYAIIRKHVHQPDVLESLIMGAAGLFRGLRLLSPYSKMITNHWGFYSHKYSLKPADVPIKTKGLRPCAFPGIRLSQLARLCHSLKGLSPLLTEAGIQRFLSSDHLAHPYWENHFIPEKPSAMHKVNLGESTKSMIALNVLYPLLGAYLQHHSHQANLSSIIEAMSNLPPEKNKVIHRFSTAGISPENALESTGLNHLFKHYCSFKKCLTCALGKSILKKE